MRVMRVHATSEAGTPSGPNDDWYGVLPDLVVVLDGVTAIGDSGCRHGPAWYSRRLGGAILTRAADASVSLTDALAGAISDVALAHDGCDLARGAPAAAVAALRTTSDRLEYLVLADIVLVLDHDDDLTVVSDERVGSVAAAERAQVLAYPIGSSARLDGLTAMRRAELAVRNRQDGYWVAGADPAVAANAVTGSVSSADIRRAALLTDGAWRIVSPFTLTDARGVLDMLADVGPAHLIRSVRAVENTDASGTAYPRLKHRDDATAVYCEWIDGSSL
jgi:hypothetical protein